MNSENLNNNSVVSDETSIKEMLLQIIGWYKYLLSKWVIILILGLLGGLAGFAYAYFQKPIYTAMTTFVLEDGEKGGGLGQYAGLASMVGLDLGGGGGGIFQGDNILELYRSRKMIEKTLLTEVESENGKCLLIDRYIEFNQLRKKWAKSPALSAIQFKSNSLSLNKKPKLSRLQDSLLGVVVESISKNHLVVSKPDKRLSIIRAEVKSPDEFFAKAFNDEIVRNVNDFYIQTKTKKSLDNVKILQQKTDSVRAVMNGAIYTAAIVSDETPNLNPTRQVQRAAPIQKSQFAAETNKAIVTELVKNLEMSKISLRKETPLIQVIDQPVFPLKQEKVSKLKYLVVGGVLAGFLGCLFLIIRKLLKGILQ